MGTVSDATIIRGLQLQLAAEREKTALSLSHLRVTVSFLEGESADPADQLVRTHALNAAKLHLRQAGSKCRPKHGMSVEQSDDLDSDVKVAEQAIGVRGRVLP